MKTQNLHSCFSDCFPFLKNKLLTPVARAKIFFTLDDLATLCVFPGEKKALYHLSCHLITVSLWDANSTLMFSFVRVSWQSPQRWSNYRQLLFFFDNLPDTWMRLAYPSTYSCSVVSRMPTVIQHGWHFMSIMKK